MRLGSRIAENPGSGARSDSPERNLIESQRDHEDDERDEEEPETVEPVCLLDLEPGHPRQDHHDEHQFERPEGLIRREASPVRARQVDGLESAHELLFWKGGMLAVGCRVNPEEDDTAGQAPQRECHGVGVSVPRVGDPAGHVPPPPDEPTAGQQRDQQRPDRIGGRERQRADGCPRDRVNMDRDCRHQAHARDRRPPRARRGGPWPESRRSTGRRARR